MPGKKSKYRRREKARSRCHAKEGEVCCEAMTKNGTKCKRIASIIFDLSKKKTFRLGPFGIEHPGINCCAFCWQHATMIAIELGLKLWDVLTSTVGPKLAGYSPEETMFVNYPKWSQEKKKMYGVESLPFF